VVHVITVTQHDNISDDSTLVVSHSVTMTAGGKVHCAQMQTNSHQLILDDCDLSPLTF